MLLANFLQGVLAFVFVAISVLLIGIILLQKNRGGGLSGAFGGVGGHTAFGTKTGDFLTWVTVGMISAFMLVAIAANYAFQPEPSETLAPTVSPGGPSGQSVQIPISPAEDGVMPVQPIARPPAEGAAAGQEQLPPATPPADEPSADAPSTPPADKDQP